MLELVISAVEGWDEEKEEFVELAKAQTLKLEHSLVSVSKWESKWNKPFLDKKQKTREETVDYIRCMTLTQNVDPKVYKRIKNEHINKVNEYISSSMTATWFSEDAKKNLPKTSSKQITSELIYYWMITLNIPSEYQKWHLNRLLTLIQVCNLENKPSKPMSKRELMSSRRALNAARRKQLNSKG
jgi:hypothetical protein